MKRHNPNEFKLNSIVSRELVHEVGVMLRTAGVSTLISGNCKKFRNIASAVTKIVMQVMSSMLDFLCGMRNRGAGRGGGGQDPLRFCRYIKEDRSRKRQHK